MTFFLDENFPKDAEELLQSQGHEVVDIRGTAREGSSDHDLFKLAQEFRAVFLTTDKDFFHTVPFQFPHHQGSLVFALARPDSQKILEKLKIALDIIKKTGVRNTCILLTDGRAYTHQGAKKGRR